MVLGPGTVVPGESRKREEVWSRSITPSQSVWVEGISVGLIDVRHLGLSEDMTGYTRGSMWGGI